MIRKEAAQQLLRWRDSLIGAGLVALGLWWALGAFGLLAWLGWALVPLGVALLWQGVRRALFHMGSNGPGVVKLDEGAVVWMGPFGGGQVALADVTRLELDKTRSPAAWRLVVAGQGALEIPVTAAGADALFDAFATLPGINTAKMLAELRNRHKNVAVVWQSQVRWLH